MYNELSRMEKATQPTGCSHILAHVIDVDAFLIRIQVTICHAVLLFEAPNLHNLVEKFLHDSYIQMTMPRVAVIRCFDNIPSR